VLTFAATNDDIFYIKVFKSFEVELTHVLCKHVGINRGLVDEILPTFSTNVSTGTSNQVFFGDLHNRTATKK